MENYYDGQLIHQAGDVLLKWVGDKTALDLGEERTDNIIKSSSHNHTVEGDFKLYEKYLIVGKKGARLCHVEHSEQLVEPGTYEIDAVKEYDHFLEESREVRD